MLLALDPGTNSPGVALFGDDRSLFAAGRIAVPDAYAERPPGERWLAVGMLVCAWAANQAGLNLTPSMTVAFEKPQWYARDKSKGDPNQLVGIAGVAAVVLGRLLPQRVLSPTPSEWIGQLPKVCPVCKGKKTQKTVGERGKPGKREVVVCIACNSSAWGTPRGRRIKSRLTDSEFMRCPDQNDAIDAVGIGLWAVKRLEPQSVFSNGRDGR